MWDFIDDPGSFIIIAPIMLVVWLAIIIIGGTVLFKNIGRLMDSRNDKTSNIRRFFAFTTIGGFAAIIALLSLRLGTNFFGGDIESDEDPSVWIKWFIKPDENTMLFYLFIWIFFTCTIIWIISLFVTKNFFWVDRINSFNVTSHNINQYLKLDAHAIANTFHNEGKIYENTYDDNLNARFFSGSKWKKQEEYELDGERAEKQFAKTFKKMKLRKEVNLSNSYINARCDFKGKDTIFEIKSTSKTMNSINAAFNTSWKYQVNTYLYLAKMKKGKIIVYSRKKNIKKLKEFDVFLTEEMRSDLKQLEINIALARKELIENKMWRKR